ncbi:hypothetical protein RHO12_02295 [Orbus sturtevantii]|uniref:hypothetical protein n=1 Tax=Orbus sturtevantii TaxID=3074109 RepID=UPI00370D0FB1
MATFDEKEFLWDEMYAIVTHAMGKKVSSTDGYSKEWLEDSKKLDDFRDWIGNTPYQEINYEEALVFFKTIKSKYEAMPDKW